MRYALERGGRSPPGCAGRGCPLVNEDKLAELAHQVRHLKVGALSQVSRCAKIGPPDQPLSFTGDAGFRGATFTGTARFSEATFNSNADFERATFHSDVVFDGERLPSVRYTGYSTPAPRSDFSSARFKGGEPPAEVRPFLSGPDGPGPSAGAE